MTVTFGDSHFLLEALYAGQDKVFIATGAVPTVALAHGTPAFPLEQGKRLSRSIRAQPSPDAKKLPFWQGRLHLAGSNGTVLELIQLLGSDSWGSLRSGA